MMYKCLLVDLLILFYAADNVNAANFCGAVIMVRPKPGGALKEVCLQVPNW